MANTVLGDVRPSRKGGPSRFIAILLIIAGLLAIFLPFVAGIAITAVVGWLLLIAAIAHFVFAWHTRGTGVVIWQVVIGLLYLLVSLYLLFHPARGLVTLTFLLAWYFFFEGVMELVLYFRVRRSHHAGWFLWDGIITLFLGILIWAHWPYSSVWVLGTIVGISLLISGVARLTLRTRQPLLGGVGGII
jgi:uncharacterized membrane protein HdeD (DUF308 family)